MKDNNLDLARKLKKLWEMRVTVIPVVISAYRMFPKSLERELEELVIGERIETIHSTELSDHREQKRFAVT